MYNNAHISQGSLEFSDDEFVAAFEDATLPEEAFKHADHVRLAWIYLRRMPLLDAIRLYGKGLREFASAHGAPGRYHETITWAFVILVNERLHDSGRDLTWADFARDNPDLVRFKDGVFFRYYDPEVLESEVARATFVLPRPTVGTGNTESVGMGRP